ncbi:hypothetical protein DFH07DRAFT_803697 [Mycena maculata]|uniref:Transmembrane protein n=1 Tax=Mycena maculata TaxID=230809 RepID=A0AAD7JWH6_9AGAR|nr:hypothetical protein DFH07DRAFT_803697 [Mycena maculata]
MQSQSPYSSEVALQPIVNHSDPGKSGGINTSTNSSEEAHGSSSGNSKGQPPPVPTAQNTQDKADQEARRQAAKDLTQSWMDRLQLISVITTFFASISAGMLQVTTPNGGQSGNAFGFQLTNAAFLAALVLHLWAAIISFMAAFFLVRYNLKEAKEEQRDVGLAPGPDPVSKPPGRILRPARTGTSERSLTEYLKLQPVWTTNPHLEQVGPFQMKPPTHLLSRCHNLCVLLTFTGFFFALVGIVAYGWTQNPVPVAVVTSASTFFCFVAAAFVIYM